MSSRPAAAVPPDTRVYAVGDVHGCATLLARLHELIRADAAAAPERRRVVVYLGDYVDRGPDSAGVVDMLIAGPGEGFEAVHLKGNHEDFLLRFLADPSIGGLWLMNGGGATLASYGVDGDGGADLRRAFLHALPKTHRAFYEGLRLWHREGTYLFVHAGIRPGRPVESQLAEDLLWIREPFLLSRADHGCVVVHGHTPVGAPEILDNRINVDTGAVWSGRLTALVLYGAERSFLQT